LTGFLALSRLGRAAARHRAAAVRRRHLRLHVHVPSQDSTMNLGISSLGIAVGLASLLVPDATAQEVLPFPPTPSASTPGLTMQDSVHRKRQLRRACATAPPTS
jgi:hypothetical protein